jgi:hypothetical protein
MRIIKVERNNEWRITRIIAVSSEEDARKLIIAVRSRMPLRKKHTEYSIETLLECSTREFVRIIRDDTITSEYESSEIKLKQKGFLYTTISKRTIQYSKQLLVVEFGEKGSEFFADFVQRTIDSRYDSPYTTSHPDGIKKAFWDEE